MAALPLKYGNHKRYHSSLTFYFNQTKGLEVIQEETESQMSSDSDQELEQLHDIGYDDDFIPRRKSIGADCVDHVDHFGVTNFVGESTVPYSHDEESENADENNGTGEILTKHIRISAKDFDPVSVNMKLKIFFLFPMHFSVKFLLSWYFAILGSNFAAVVPCLWTTSNQPIGFEWYHRGFHEYT